MNVFASLLATALIASRIASPTGDVFDDADSDGNGVLTYDEIRAVLPNVSRDIFMAADTNGDGVVDEGEFQIGVNEGFFSKR